MCVAFLPVALRAVVAAHAVADDARVVELRRQPGQRRVAVVALGIGRDVVRLLARRLDAVVARCAAAEHVARGRPWSPASTRSVEWHASQLVGRLDVRRVLAGRLGAVVAGRAAVRDAVVGEARRHPGRRRVAVLAAAGLGCVGSTCLVPVPRSAVTCACRWHRIRSRWQLADAVAGASNLPAGAVMAAQCRDARGERGSSEILAVAVWMWPGGLPGACDVVVAARAAAARLVVIEAARRHPCRGRCGTPPQFSVLMMWSAVFGVALMREPGEWQVKHARGVPLNTASTWQDSHGCRRCAPVSS